MNPWTVYRMLKIVESAGRAGTICRDFAAKAWPDSKVWRQPGRKAFMATAAGGMLGRLRRAGYVATFGRGRWARHALTAEGAAFIRNFHVPMDWPQRWPER